jgi:hypothetical protein
VTAWNPNVTLEYGGQPEHEPAGILDHVIAFEDSVAELEPAMNEFGGDTVASLTGTTRELDRASGRWWQLWTAFWTPSELPNPWPRNP